MERESRKRSSSAGSEKWRELVADRKKMKGHCSTGQSPQWAVVPMEEEEDLVSPIIKFRLSQLQNVTPHTPFALFTVVISIDTTDLCA